MHITYMPLSSLPQTLQWPITSNTDFLIIFLTINPNPPFLNFLFGRKLKLELGENPQFLAECWQTLSMCDQMFDTGLEPMTSVVGGRRLDD